MAKAVPFDTLAYAKKLEASGVDVEQAEAHAKGLAEVLEASFVTKEDSDKGLNNLANGINALRNELRQEISELRGEMNVKFAEMDVKFAEVKSEVIKWVFGISFAQAALIISVLKFFH